MLRRGLKRPCTGLTRQGLADAIGIHVHRIKRYEPGKKITKCCGVTTDWLLLDEAERSPDDDLRLQFGAMGQLRPGEKEEPRCARKA